MKKKSHYLLDIAVQTNFDNKMELTPLLDGKNIKEDGSGYLIPRFFDSRKKVKFLCDFHGWIGTKPYGYGYPISLNMLTTLKEHNLEDEFIKTKVLFKEEETVYFVWKLNSNNFIDFINFERSSFCEWDDLDNLNSTKIKVSNFTELTDIEMEEGWLNWGFDRAVMKPEFKEIDAMAMPYPYGILISERLKNALEEAELTGFEITPFPVEFEYME